MKTTLTKTYHFSASFSQDSKVYGHNYVLEITTAGLSAAEEAVFDDTVRRALIEPVASKDFTLHVPFLKNTPINDTALLEKFFDILKRELKNVPVRSLALARDTRTRTTLWTEEG